MIQRRMHQLNGPSYRATLGGRPEVPLPGVAGRVVAVTAHLPKPPFPTVLKMGVISESVDIHRPTQTATRNRLGAAQGMLPSGKHDTAQTASAYRGEVSYAEAVPERRCAVLPPLSPPQRPTLRQKQGEARL